MAEFAINNAVHASTGHTPFYLNYLRNPQIPSALTFQSKATLSGGGSTTRDENSRKIELNRSSIVPDITTVCDTNNHHNRGDNCNAWVRIGTQDVPI